MSIRIARPSLCSALVGCALLLVGGFVSSARADGPVARATITVRAVHPDREAQAAIDLFRGGRAASPAAALSAWKRASREPKRLGKLGDALIATLNPHMVPELRGLDDAEIAITFVPGSPRWDWRVRIPHDDGTLAALGPTADLSGGQVQPSLGAYRVDRFPGANLVLLARGPAGLLAANSREQLEAAVAASELKITPAPIDSGWLLRGDPSASDTWTSLAGRRWAEAARATGCQSFSGRARFARTSLVATVVGRFEADTPVVAAIDPGWLDFIPARGPLVAVGFRVDPRAEAWTRVFDLIDRVERADPERAKVAPSRLRLALAARATGVRLEADVLPHLQGVAGWLGVADGNLDRAAIALDLDDEATARRLIDGVRGRRMPDAADEVVEAGQVGGRPLRLIRRRARVFLAWGDRAWAESRAALDNPDRSAQPWLSLSRTGARPTRVGAVWPDQIPAIPANSPLAQSLTEAPPIRWAGANEGNRTTDEIWADGLDATVRRFLDRLPLDPPPGP